MKRKSLILVLIVVMIMALVAGVFKYDKTVNEHDTTSTEYIEYNGQKYVLNNNQSVFLLYGVDKDSTYLKENEDVFYVRNQVQADFLNLVIVDKETSKIKIININRDSMFETSTITDNYEFEYTQLALAHTYGSGGSDSSVNLMKAVSSIFDVYIGLNDYVKIPYDIVGKITDAVGGVEVEVLQNMSEEDDRLVKGEVVKLDGDLSVLYVKNRINLDDDTNKSRMKRQTQFINEVIKKYESIDEIEYNKVSEIADMIYSNLSITYLQNLIDIINVEDIEFYDIEGYNSKGSEFIEFNVDREMAKNLAIELFYLPIE